MHHASSQVPFASRRSTDRDALVEHSPHRRFSKSAGPHRKWRRLGAEGSPKADLRADSASDLESDPTSDFASDLTSDLAPSETGTSIDRGHLQARQAIADTREQLLGRVDEIPAHRTTGSEPNSDSSDRPTDNSMDGSRADDSAEDQLSQLQARLQQQQQLRSVEHKLRNSLNLSTIYGVAVVEAARLFNAQQTVLMAYSAQQQQWTRVAQYCQSQAIAWQKPCRLTQEEFPDFARQLFQGDRLQIAANQPLPTTETRQWLACWPGSWLLLPVLQPVQQSAFPDSSRLDSSRSTSSRDVHWGVMALALPPGDDWTDDTIAGAQSLVHELSAAIAHADQYQNLLSANAALQKLALSDGLTGLANRRCFDEHLADEWQRLAREQRPLSLILCDLDHFKQYNDTFGHPAGDRCLAKVAAALKSGPRRPADLVARYGGEEFAVILPNTDTNGAWRIAQKLHHSIRALRIAHTENDAKPYVTVTMGVSTIIPGHDTTAQVLVQAADLALYHAKQQGRDRTYVHAYYNTVSEEAQRSPAADGSQLEIMPPEES